MVSSHDFQEDKRNKKIKIYVNGKYYIRDKAKISVFDSSVLLGDGVWTSGRIFNGNFIFLKDHLDRLYKDLKLISLKLHLNRKELSNLIYKTIKINKMKNDVHMRIIISRGLRSTPYQSEKVVVSNPSIIIIPEYKKPNVEIYKKGLRLVTVSTIRGNLNAQNPQINSLSKLNCIIACIEGHKKGGDESLMFDINGNIATNNSTHFFYIKNNSVYTSKGKYQVTGITRQKIIDICKKNKIKVFQKNFKLAEVLKADEAFVTGSFGGVVPVNSINKKKYKLNKNNLTYQLKSWYEKLLK